MLPRFGIMSAPAFVRGFKVFVFDPSKITTRAPTGSLSTLAVAALSLNNLLRASQPRWSPSTIEFRPKIGHRQWKGAKPVLNTPSSLSYGTYAAINSASVVRPKIAFFFCVRNCIIYVHTQNTHELSVLCIIRTEQTIFFTTQQLHRQVRFHIIKN